jgi:hypothetical protein
MLTVMAAANKSAEIFKRTKWRGEIGEGSVGVPNMFSIDRRGLQKRGSPSIPPRSKTQFFFISLNNIYSSLPIPTYSNLTNHCWFQQ